MELSSETICIVRPRCNISMLNSILVPCNAVKSPLGFEWWCVINSDICTWEVNLAIQCNIGLIPGIAFHHVYSVNTIKICGIYGPADSLVTNLARGSKCRPFRWNIMRINSVLGSAVSSYSSRLPGKFLILLMGRWLRHNAEQASGGGTPPFRSVPAV